MENNFLNKVLREALKGIRKILGLRDAQPEFPIDFSRKTIALCKKVKPFTMTSYERIAVLEMGIKYLVKQNVPGDMVECGVARGGSILVMAMTLVNMQAVDRRLWLYDTFEGMPEPTEYDLGRYGTNAIKKYHKHLEGNVSKWINHPIEEVKSVIAKSEYPASNIRFIKGKVEDTLQKETPEQIAMLRLDTDFYESTKVEMDILYPKVSPGGLILLDDYYKWQGSKKAVDEFIETNKICIFWSRIDSNSAIGVKR